MTLTHILYLHGFRSSPQSTKARTLGLRVAERLPEVHWWCPALPPSPKAAMEMLIAGIRNWPPESMAVVGSSLGGFYATVVAERCQCRAVLLNPAVEPARDLAKYIGEHTQWHNAEEKFYFRPEYVDELRAMQPGMLTQPERYFSIFAKGDEVLDWREMHARYAGCHIKLLEGSDHALSDFDNYSEEILEFLAQS
ncbi:MAG: esterase [Rhodoferax sp.]|nr:esterase [Rhodoferax sp.]MCF8208893.1 esterase [Rhodoferax sp.]